MLPILATDAAAAAVHVTCKTESHKHILHFVSDYVTMIVLLSVLKLMQSNSGARVVSIVVIVVVDTVVAVVVVVVVIIA